MKYLRLLAITALVACGTVAAQGMAIKEYELGAPMTSCPSDARATKVNGFETVCMLGPTTLANQPVEMVIVRFYQGKINGAYFKLRDSGQYANSDVLEALKEKFGLPSGAQSHLNRYSWAQGAQDLSFDGWGGHVLLMDTDIRKKIDAENAAKNKSDL